MMPFPGGLESTENATLVFSCMAALFYAAMLPLPENIRRSAGKTMAVGLLAALAVLLGGPTPLTIALFLSALGDLFLSRAGERAFLAGLASFLVAHLAYIVLFSSVDEGFGMLIAQPWRMVPALLLVGSGVAMLMLLRRRVGPKLLAPITAYVVAILGMGLAALTVPAPIVVVGALLFAVSDALLATERFLLAEASRHLVWMRYAVWGIYFCAQFCITVGFLA